jgi:putative hydrolase of the HAD superfamily
MIKTIAFDADDTLWHNERIFVDIKDRYKALLGEYHDADWIEQRLDEAETVNIQHFGYGVKGFTLSMIETAIDLTEGRITGNQIKEIIGYAREMLSHPVDLLEGVKDTVQALSHRYNLMVITKGDLFDQEAKLARSGVGEYFNAFEIIPQKNAKTYKYILRRHQIAAEQFVMVGNSLKSDILPVLEIGARAVHIPYEIEWFHEMVTDDELQGKDFARLDKMSDLPGWLNKIEDKS